MLILRAVPTARDFVPWRFLDAGQLGVRVFRYYRRHTIGPQPAPLCHGASKPLVLMIAWAAAMK
jgi:hypothetical protein